MQTLPANWLDLGVRSDRPELVEAQFRALIRLVPLLYATLCANSLALSYAFIKLAPLSLTVVVPGFLTLVASVRALKWWSMRDLDIGHEARLHHMRMLVVLTVVLGLAFTKWAVALFHLGGDIQKIHLAYFISVSLFTFAICLTHVRTAAIGLVTVSCTWLVIELIHHLPSATVGIAVNVTLVGGTIVALICRNYADFVELIGSQSDLATKHEEANELVQANHRMATEDMLTKLPNRRWFMRELSRLAENHSQHPLTLALIDLDGFKPINDLYGHRAGDRLLAEIGKRLSRQTTNDVHIARLGGDEFGVICSNLNSRAEAQALGLSLLLVLGEVFSVDENELKVDASIGFSSIGYRSSTTERLFEEADYALNYGKRNARGRITFFAEEHLAEIRSASQIDQALRHACFESELSIVYQPVVDHTGSSIEMFEALARWNSPTLGPVPPNAFIAAAERAGNINTITTVLFGIVLRDMVNWPDWVRISFNLSAHDIMSPTTMRRIATDLRRTGIDPARIEFEVTETAIMHDFNRAARALKFLKALGCSIALDDFGTGYSSLSHVHQLPLDKIKVDRSFIRDIHSSKANATLVKSVFGLCRNLGLDCTVEGIESEAQRRAIAKIGSPALQGFLFGMPVEQYRAMEMLSSLNVACRT